MLTFLGSSGIEIENFPEILKILEFQEVTTLILSRQFYSSDLFSRYYSKIMIMFKQIFRHYKQWRN